MCLSALYAADEDGAIPSVGGTFGLHYLGVPVRNQMRAVLSAAEEICRAAGTSLANVTRAQHFVSDLNAVYPAIKSWQEKLGDAPIPFGAVRTLLPIPGCCVVLDMWAYHLDR